MKNDPRFQPLDASQSPRFADIATFFRLPRHEVGPDVDIALVGVPFDLGANFRTGARQGPASVREATRAIRRRHPVSGIEPFALCNVADLGDTPIHAFDLLGSLELIQDCFQKITDAGAMPLAIGGDHTIPLPILRILAKDRPVGVVQFDAHADTLDTLIGNKFNHATTFRRAVEEGLIDPKRTIQIGLRGSRFSADDVVYGEAVGMRLITMEDYEAMGRNAVIGEIDRVTSDGATYVTFDIDGLDAAYAMGTGVPEVGGFNMRDAQAMLRSLQGKNLVGADICEVAPMYDPTGQTQLNAANLMFELLCILADSKTRHS
ncbi:MAG: agmatinase [Acidobacteria bacterium]|nr:MAG: agmatinase [Acidobacteriota bacterium]